MLETDLSMGAIKVSNTQPKVNTSDQDNCARLKSVCSIDEAAMLINGRPSKVLFWKAMIQKWNESGMSKSAFCRNEKLHLNTFNIWLTALSARKTIKKDFAPPDIEVNAPIPCTGKEISTTEAESLPEPQNIASLSAPGSAEPVAELCDVTGKIRISIFPGANPETVSALMKCFLRE